MLKLKWKGAMRITEVTAKDKIGEAEFVSLTAQMMVGTIEPEPDTKI